MKFKCHNCGNELFQQDRVNETFEINGKIYYVTRIPALVCTRCEERFYLPEVYDNIYDTIHKQHRLASKIEAEVYEYI